MIIAIHFPLLLFSLLSCFRVEGLFFLFFVFVFFFSIWRHLLAMLGLGDILKFELLESYDMLIEKLLILSKSVLYNATINSYT